MSLGRQNDNEFISPETYVSNQVKIEQARKLLEQMEDKNRRGLQKFTEREQQQQAAQAELLKQKEKLQRKIQEGLEAQRLIEELDKQQSTLSLAVAATETPSTGGARIEEVPDNNQLPAVSATPSETSVNHHHNYKSLPQVQSQPPQQSYPYTSQPLQPQTHTYKYGSAGSIVTPVPTHYSRSVFPAAPAADNLSQQQHASGASQPQTYSDLFAPKPMAYWYPSQSSNNNLNSNGSASYTPYQPKEPPRPFSESQQQNSTVVDQPTSGQPSKSGGVVQQTGSSHYRTAASLNTAYQGKRPKHTSANMASGVPGTTSQSIPPPQLPQPQPRPNFRFVDSFGVPYLPFTDEQVADMHKRFTNWQSQAPPGTIDKIHEIIYLHKDTTKEQTSWIYVPETPQSTRYSRTSEVDKFFKILLDNARLARVNRDPPPALNPSSSSRPNKTFNMPTQSTVQNDVQYVGSSKSLTPTSSMTPNLLVKPYSSVAHVNIPASLTPALVKSNQTPLPRPAQSSNKDSATPSGLTRKLPLPSSVNKKHLSQSLLLALGKRPRTNGSATRDEQPAKRHAPETSQQDATTGMSSSSTQIPANPAPTAVTVAPTLSASSALPSYPKVRFTEPRVSGVQEHIRSGSAQQNASSTAKVFYASQHYFGQSIKAPVAIAVANTAQKISTTSNSVQSSAQPNSYVPLLLASGKRAPQLVSMPIRETNVAQYQGQQPKALTLPVASGSSQVTATSSLQYLDQNTSSTQQKEPLFLPSSSSERGPSISVTKSEEESNMGPVSKGKKRKQMFVLAPEPPDYLVRLRKRMAGRADNQSDTEITPKQFQRLQTGTSSVSTSVIDKEVSDSSSIAESQTNADDPEQKAQRNAIDLACSRLQQAPCRWNGCSVILNSVNALIKHLNSHKPERRANNQGQFICRWIQCGRMCSFDGNHLETHPLLAMKCAYKGCDESYRSGSQLLKHHNSRHKLGELKPSTGPSPPVLDTLPTVPSILPAYLLVTKMAQPATITPERHELLCRWVIRSIVNSDQEKPTRLRTRKTAKAPSRPPPTVGNDYEFITTRSTRYSSYLSQAVDLPLEDLDPATISQMVDEGLTLWPTKDEDVSDQPQHDIPPSPTPMTPSTQTSGIVKEELGDAPVRHVNTTDSALHRRDHSDEAAVKAMLTGQ